MMMRNHVLHSRAGSPGAPRLDDGHLSQAGGRQPTSAAHRQGHRSCLMRESGSAVMGAFLC